MGIIFSSVIIVLLLVVFAAVTQAAVEYLVDCDDNNTKKEMYLMGRTKGCHDCIWGNWPEMCKDPKRDPKSNYCCCQWEWRYE